MLKNKLIARVKIYTKSKGSLFSHQTSSKKHCLTIFAIFVSLVSWQIWQAFILLPNYIAKLGSHLIANMFDQSTKHCFSNWQTINLYLVSRTSKTLAWIDEPSFNYMYPHKLLG
jgi:hypothetical protein